MEDIIKTIGLIILVIILSFFLIKIWKGQYSFIKEGLTTSTTSTSSASSGSSSITGYASNASAYATAIKALNIKYIDKLSSITKYKTNYEDIIINLEDYINLTMLDTILNLNLSDTNTENIKEALITLGQLNNSKTALDEIMKYVDSLTSS